MSSRQRTRTNLRLGWLMNYGNSGAVRLARLKLTDLPRKRLWRLGWAIRERDSPSLPLGWDQMTARIADEPTSFLHELRAIHESVSLTQTFVQRNGGR